MFSHPLSDAITMKVAIYFDTKFGSNQKVAAHLSGALIAKGHTADVHRISDVRPKELPPADLYVFSSPTRLGKPKGSMRRFLKRARLAPNAKYALIATHGEPRPNKKTGQMPTPEEIERYQGTLRTMSELLAGKGTKVAEMKLYVSSESMSGPLLEGWEKKVERFADEITK
jgi:menaquinone-dependent protoporphyrinogen IX oxidase